MISANAAARLVPGFGRIELGVTVTRIQVRFRKNQ